MFAPWNVTADGSGNFASTDVANKVVRVVAGATGAFSWQAMTAGNTYTIAGNGTDGYSGDGGPATSAQLVAIGVAADRAGNLVISDANN